MWGFLLPGESEADVASSFLQGFDQLRLEGLLCDVTLVPGDGDEVFPVHRAMMASASDYFKAMFTGRARSWWWMTCQAEAVEAGGHPLSGFLSGVQLPFGMKCPGPWFGGGFLRRP